MTMPTRFLPAFVLAACAPDAAPTPADVTAPDERPLPGGTEPGKADFAASALLWPSPRIPVCWEADALRDDLADERAWVEDAVRGSWETVSALAFEGWGPCGPDAPGVRIGLTDAAPHTLGLGTDLDGVPGAMRLNVDFASWSPGCAATPEFCVRAGAVHEFGHAVALAHEQGRDDTPGWCAREDAYGDLSFTDWDLASIMNYCNPEWTGGGALSDSDVIAIRALYGHAPGTSVPAIGDGSTWSAGTASTDPRLAEAAPEREPLLGDVDGDGRDDLVVHDAGRWWVRRSDGVGFRPAEAFADGADPGPGTALLADMDGDGLDDAVFVTAEGTWYAHDASGDAFAAPRWLGEAPDGGTPLAADLDGDGRDDAVMVDPLAGRWSVAPSVGTGIAPFTAWADRLGAGAAAHRLGDVTGDGRADLVVAWAGSGTWEVAPSLGTAAGEPTVWAQGHGALASARFLADVDGDGRDDAVVHERERGRWFARPADGGRFGDDRFLGDYLGASRPEVAPTLLLGDRDGDGLADLLLHW